MKRLSVVLLCVFYSAISLAQWNKDTTYFIYENLGPTVNSEYNESGPRISPDGSTLYFFRADHPENGFKSNDIWVSHLKEDSTWGEAEHLGNVLNNHMDNAVHSVSADGNKLLVHDIYLPNGTSKNGVSITTKKADGTWGFPVPLKIKKYHNKSPLTSFYLSDDWETMIMAVEEEGETIGKQDLYVIFHDKEKDVWSHPLDLGEVINTTGTEATAFLASDQKTLYFSSDGHPNSLGGFDIYKSVRLDSTWQNWSTPENMGAPYNTADDEYYFSLPSHAGGWAYLAHSHHHGHSDITRIKKVTEPLPPPLIYVHGRILDKESGLGVHGKVQLFKLPEYDDIGIAETDSNTHYVTMLKAGSKYEFQVHVDGYEDAKVVIDLLDFQPGQELEQDIILTPIKPLDIDTAQLEEKPFVLENVEFDTGKWDIKSKYNPMLDRLVAFLKGHKDSRYRINGHTDYVGKEEDNQILSENRAKAVADYLIAKGIPQSQIDSKGFGELSPIDTNKTAAGRQHNRRVELEKLK